jgi:preprotein translocase subunit Sec61beta
VKTLDYVVAAALVVCVVMLAARVLHPPVDEI